MIKFLQKPAHIAVSGVVSSQVNSQQLRVVAIDRIVGGYVHVYMGEG